MLVQSCSAAQRILPRHRAGEQISSKRYSDQSLHHVVSTSAKSSRCTLWSRSSLRLLLPDAKHDIAHSLPIHDCLELFLIEVFNIVPLTIMDRRSSVPSGIDMPFQLQDPTAEAGNSADAAGYERRMSPRSNRERSSSEARVFAHLDLGDEGMLRRLILVSTQTTD